MKTIRKCFSLLFLFILLAIGCEDKIVYEDSFEVGSVYVDGITDNVINLYTGETFKIEMNYLPKEAQLTEDINYIYSSDNKKVFAVDAEGVLTGVTPGEAMLHISSSNYPNLKTVSMVSVTDKVFWVTEIEVDNILKNLTLTVDDELAINDYIKVLPDNASNKKYSLKSSNEEVLTVTEDGIIKAVSLGEAKLIITAEDNREVTATCDISVKMPIEHHIDRSQWAVYPSHELPVDAAIKNSPESLIDGSTATCLSMVKPDKSYAGVSIPAEDDVYFTIDMNKKTKFNYLKIFHRTSISYSYLRVWGVALYGSDDGDNFELIQENIPIEYEIDSCTVRFVNNYEYRYLKVLYTDWDPKSGSSIQIAEFELGLFGF